MKKRAFSLVEMLVVIAITIIVAGIAFPVLASTKSAAMQRQSISDMRQIAMAALIYRSDWSARDYGDMASMGLPVAYDQLFGQSPRSKHPVLQPPVRDPAFPVYYYMPLDTDTDKRPFTWEQAALKYRDHTVLVCDPWIAGREPKSGWWYSNIGSLENRIWGVDLSGQLIRKQAYGYYYDLSRWEPSH